MALLSSHNSNAIDPTRQNVSIRNGKPMVAFKNAAFLNDYDQPRAPKSSVVPVSTAVQVQPAAASINPLTNPVVKYGFAAILGLTVAAGIYHAVN